MPELDAISITATLKAPVGTVFRYFTEGERISLWMGPKCSADPRVGGSFELYRGKGVQISGAFEVIEEPHRVVISWGVVDDAEMPPGSTKLEAFLAPHAEGATLTITHSGLSASWREREQAAWGRRIEKLQMGLDTGGVATVLSS